MGFVITLFCTLLMFTNLRKCQCSYMLVKTPSGEHLVAYAVCYPLNTFIQKKRNKSRQYKKSQYMNLSENLKTEFSNYSVVVHTIEITCLGLVSDCSQFCSNNLETTLPDQIKNQIIRSVISSSFLIYCNRNKNSD
jgi:hypothetical protein